MELSPLGGGPPPLTPGPTETQTPPAAPTPVHETPQLPPNTGWTNPYAQPTPSAAPVYAEKSSGSTGTTRAIVFMVISLALGGMRVYSRYQRQQERYEPTYQQALDQDNNAPRSFRDDTAPATPAPSLPRSLPVTPQTRPAFYRQPPRFAPPPAPVSASPVNMPQADGRQSGAASYPPPSPQVQAQLQRDLLKVANGRGVARVTVSPLGNGMYQADVTFTNAEVSRLHFDGTAWTPVGGSAAAGESSPSNGGGSNVGGAPSGSSANAYPGNSAGQTTAAPGTSTAPGNTNPVLTNPPEPPGNPATGGSTPPPPPTGG